MKKITFVQKQDNSSYDPVSNFFAKKTVSSLSKPSNIPKPVIASKATNNPNLIKMKQKQTQKQKLKNIKTQSRNTKKQKSQTVIQKKQEFNSNTFGQESIYLIKKQSNQIESPKQTIKKVQHQKDEIRQNIQSKLAKKEQKYKQQVNLQSKKLLKSIQQQSRQGIQNSSIQNQKQKKYPNTTASNEQPGKQLQSLRAKIKDLQKSIQEYERKLTDYQQRQEEFIKTEEKYKKLQKQHKLCSQKNKNITQIKSQLVQKQNLIKNLTSPQSNVSFFKKRNALLLNKIQQLKRTNRDLVLRIKSYKGTDLVQLALQSNQNQVCREYQIEYQQNLEQFHAEIESMLSEFIILTHQFLENKTSKGKKQLKEADQHHFLLKISSLAQKISLAYIDKFKLCPLPKCNQDAMNVYAQIQSIRNKQQMRSIIQKEDLNFAITQENIQILNNLQSNIAEMTDMRVSIANSQKLIRKQKNSQKVKINNYLEVYQKRCNFHTLFFIQALCQLTFLKDWLSKKLKQLQKQLTNFYARIKQIKNIVDLGGNTARQSLWLYIQTNIEQFMLIVPNLNINIKGIQTDYQQLQNLK